MPNPLSTLRHQASPVSSSVAAASERQALLPSTYHPTPEDYLRYAATPGMPADQRHRAAFQTLFPSYRVVAWAPLFRPLSLLETENPRLYAAHPELPHRGNTWTLLGDPDPHPDWPTHPRQIHLRYNVASLPAHVPVTTPPPQASHLNHYDFIEKIPAPALFSFTQLRTLLHSHEIISLGPSAPLFPQAAVDDLTQSAPRTPAPRCATTRAPSWGAAPTLVGGPTHPPTPPALTWRRDPPD